MRYISLLLFALFLVFSVDFATQNTTQVILNYKIDIFRINFSTERPVFVPIFFTFAFGIIFSVFYFFIYHAFLLRKLSLRRKEIKKLEGLLEAERDKKKSIVQHHSEQQITNNLQNNLDYNDDQESLIIDDTETGNLKK